MPLLEGGWWIVHHEVCRSCLGYGLAKLGELRTDRPCPECAGLGYHPMASHEDELERLAQLAADTGPEG